MKNSIKLLTLSIMILVHAQAYSREVSYKTINDYTVFSEDNFYSHIQQIVITQPEFLESVSKQNEINEDTAALMNGKSYIELGEINSLMRKAEGEMHLEKVEEVRDCKKDVWYDSYVLLLLFFF